MTASPLPFSAPIRVNQIGAGVARRLEADADARARIARALDLQALDAFVADITVTPAREGWRLTGRVRAQAIQTCGVTLEPLPKSVDADFEIGLIEAPETVEPREIDVSMDDESPDWIEDGRIDLGQYAVEQLALNLDPFPRKPGAAFVAPDTSAEVSPFAVLSRLASKTPNDET